MARRPGDVVGFRRIFVLFCTLVLAPAVLLSGFGVIAILNEQEADDARQQRAAQDLLRDAQARLLLLIDAQASAGGPRILIGDDGVLLSGEIEGAERLAASGRDLGPGESAFAHSPNGLVALTREPAGLAAVRIDDQRLLDAPLAGPSAPEGMSVELVIANERGEPAEVGVIDRLLRDAVRNPDAARSQARAQMEPPFDRYGLVVTVEGGGGAGTARAIYIVLLSLFYGLLITGVVLTSRLIWKETRLSRLKTDFVSHVSHELRTPLTSIRMFIETLQMGRASREEQAECLDLLNKETERLSDMIERVLDYARIRAGRREFARVSTRPENLVDAAIRAFRAQSLADPNFELVRDVEDALPDVVVDPEATVEALLNLVGNAHKHAGEARYIRVFARDGKRRGSVAVGVEDRGPGLHKREHKRVFERFYQAGQLLTRTSKGSGLGLAITKGIVEGQGGRIRIESAPGEGATFTMELPGAEA